MARRFVVLGVGLQLLLGLVGCGSPSEAPPELGVVLLTTTVVPSDVQCINLPAVGGTTVTRNFDVVPAQTSSLTATGLPTGTVTLTEMASNVPCSQVAASTPPTWVSEAPVTVQLVPGQSVPVTIVLRRAGQEIITSTFADNVLDGGIGNVDGGGWDGAISTDLPIAAEAPKDTDLPVGPDLAIGTDLPVGTDAVVAPTTIYQINCGSSSAVSPFTADVYSSGGTMHTVTNTITTSGVTKPRASGGVPERTVRRFHLYLAQPRRLCVVHRASALRRALPDGNR